MTTMRRVAPRTKEEKATALAKDCFSLLPAKNWYLIPKSADEAKRNDSICWALRMRFDDLLPVLVAAKILIRMKANAEEYAVNMEPIKPMNITYKNVNFEVRRSWPTVQSKQVSIYRILRVTTAVKDIPTAPIKYDEPAGGLNRIQSITKTGQELLERVQAFKLTVVVHVLPSLDSIELVSAVGDFDNSVPIVSPSEASNRSVGDFDNSVPVKTDSFRRSSDVGRT